MNFTEEGKWAKMNRINALIKREFGWIVSDNLVHKICKKLNIKSKAKHYKYKKIGEKFIKYSNQICGNWTTSRPCEKNRIRYNNN